jgi:signal transduction histidine kinase
VLAGAVQRQQVRRAFQPLDRALHEAAGVVGLGQGARLSVSGPREVRTLLEAMNAVLDRLDDAFHAQARFTAEAAHELRTPVTVMLGELDVTLRRPRGPEEYRATLATVREAVERLRDLVAGLTALARVDAGQVEQVRERLRASDVARAAAEAESRALDAAGCALRVRVERDAEVEGHPALLRAAVGNLLRNAATHDGDGARRPGRVRRRRLGGRDPARRARRGVRPLRPRRRGEAPRPRGPRAGAAARAGGGEAPRRRL